MGELDSYLSGCKHKRGRSAAYEFHMPSVVFVLHDFVFCYLTGRGVISRL